MAALGEGSELFIGLVGAVGTDLEEVSNVLSASLDQVSYASEVVRLSELLHGISRWRGLPNGPEDTRICRHMDAGNELRGIVECGDALAVLGIVDIRKRIREARGPGNAQDVPIPRQAYILRSLKHPSEVDTLRAVYGPAFLLIAAYSPRRLRLDRLARAIAASRGSRAAKHRATAEALDDRDQEEAGDRFGQNVRDTFGMADVFLDVRGDALRESADRFIRLIFGHPYTTPTPEEYAMFQAGAASLRSASLSRQVGAALASEAGEIVALGTNEVPKAGGGLYWEGDEPDHRDFRRGRDTSDEMKRLSLQEILTRLADGGWLAGRYSRMKPLDRTRQALPLVTDTHLTRTIEYGRSVHAEMAAFMDAARRGAVVDHCTLYTTTFPCHDCARHVVASGVERVVYIEPYAKSLASDFHDDSIAIDEEHPGNRIPFRPFVGVAPNRYMQLFKAPQRKDADGKALPWSPKKALPKFETYPAGYIENETDAIASLYEQMRLKGLRVPD